MKPAESAVSEAGTGLHRFAVLMAGLVVLLIAVGANVTSRDAGLAVPDWPLSYGSLNPPGWWQITNVRAEHGHRLLAGGVALLTVVLAVWVYRREPRTWVRRLAILAVAAVATQALLGGLTVLFFLPTPISVAHAALAEIFLCLTVAVAVATSPSWTENRSQGGPQAGGIGNRGLVPLATATTSLIFVQILLGAVMRHSGAGLAIPDFPWVFGGLVPPRFDFPIGVHYAHRVGALVVVLLVATVVIRVLLGRGGWHRSRSLSWPALGLMVLVPIQVFLGAAVVLTSRAVLPNTVHVATGATLLATSLVLTLHSWRQRQETI